MRKFLIVIVALAVSSCATIRNPVTTDRLANIESAYGIALSTAVGYRNLRLCKKGEDATPLNVCARRDIILKLQRADNIAQDALKNARTFVNNHPLLDAYDVINAAQQAVSTFEGILTAYGVRSY